MTKSRKELRKEFNKLKESEKQERKILTDAICIDQT